MSIFLAVTVAAGFIWSIIFFFAAVFIRYREQEAGFGWALLGAALFAITFADRLPGHSKGPRSIVNLLPAVKDGHQLFTSSLVALIVLFMVYLFRMIVFCVLFLAEDSGGLTPATSTVDGSEDLVNDLVAPTLSFVCFVICAVSLIAPVYGLGTILTVLLAVSMLATYYLVAIAEVVEVIRERLTDVVLAINGAVLTIIEYIAWAEMRRRGVKSDMTAFEDRRSVLNRKKSIARKTRDERINRITQPWNRRRSPRRRAFR
jgi:hypothetical protein